MGRLDSDTGWPDSKTRRMRGSTSFLYQRAFCFSDLRSLPLSNSFSIWLYGRGNGTTAGDFGNDPRCPRLGVRQPVGSHPVRVRVNRNARLPIPTPIGDRADATDDYRRHPICRMVSRDFRPPQTNGRGLPLDSICLLDQQSPLMEQSVRGPTVRRRPTSNSDFLR